MILLEKSSLVSVEVKGSVGAYYSYYRQQKAPIENIERKKIKVKCTVLSTSLIETPQSFLEPCTVAPAP
jgi:hypothetical protein